MKKTLAPVGVLLIGAVAVTVLLLSRSSPEKRPFVEPAQRVAGITVKAMTVVPRITAYGDVKPDRTWTAVAQVPGQVVWKSPKLNDGEFVGEGEELLRLDKREFVLALSKAKADTDKIRARLVELETNQTNIGGQLELLREAVAYNEKELERQKNLYESKAVSASMVEQQRITVLEQQRALATLQASHDAMPSQITYHKAELAAAEAAIRQAELNLEYTVFRAPFRGRLDRVTAELRQYIPAGQVLLELDSTSAAEVSISVSPLRLAMLAGVQLENIIDGLVEKREPPPRPRIRVLTDNGNGGAEWEARFGRIGASVDPATRMIERVVIVDNPYGAPERGTRSRFPLSKGTFCTVIMYGYPQNDRLVIPRQAIHDGTVYLVTSDSRLEKREVSVDYYLGNHAILKSGLSQGERLVVNDIVPAIPGMLLEVAGQDNYYEKAAREIGEDDDA